MGKKGGTRAAADERASATRRSRRHVLAGLLAVGALAAAPAVARGFTPRHELVQWVEGQGGLANVVVLAGPLRGLAADSGVQTGDALIKLPRDAMVRISQDASVDCAQAGSILLAEKLLLTIKSGAMQPYVDSLPTKAELLMPSDDLGVGQLTSWVAGACTSQVAQWERDYAAWALKADFAWADFKWARGIVQTRSFGEDSNWSLLPLVDITNHGTDPNVRGMWTAEGYELRALRPLAAGEPLVISYQVQSNQELFVRYGFAIDDPQFNMHSVVSLPLNLTDLSGPRPQKLALLAPYLGKLISPTGEALATVSVSFEGQPRLWQTPLDLGTHQLERLVALARFLEAGALDRCTAKAPEPPSCPPGDLALEARALRRLARDANAYARRYQTDATGAFGAHAAIVERGEQAVLRKFAALCEDLAAAADTGEVPSHLPRVPSIQAYARKLRALRK